MLETLIFLLILPFFPVHVGISVRRPGHHPPQRGVWLESRTDSVARPCSAGRGPQALASLSFSPFPVNFELPTLLFTAKNLIFVLKYPQNLNTFLRIESSPPVDCSLVLIL